MLPTMLAPESNAPNTERTTHSRQSSVFLLAAVFLHLLFILQLIPANLHAITTSNSTTAFSSSLADVHQRSKRQWSSPYQQQFPPQMQMCPPQCFACSPMHCQAYQCIQPQVANMVRCCCRPVMIVHPQPDLKSACDGEEAVAACLNGLCGQGYFCNVNKFCCRCQTGKSLGRCVNNLCPVGYACNSNDYCCAIGAGSVLGPCINGRCPEGYECGAGELCYARSGNSWAGASTQKPPINGNNVRRNYPPVRRSRPRWTYSLESGAARRGENKRRRQKQRHTWTDYDNDNNKWQKGKRVMDFDDYEL